MAIDVYLQLDGIKGESTDHGHTGWIECDNVFWSVLQPASATASTAGGHTAERTELSDITFNKVADLSKPMFARVGMFQLSPGPAHGQAIAWPQHW